MFAMEQEQQISYGAVRQPPCIACLLVIFLDVLRISVLFKDLH